MTAARRRLPFMLPPFGDSSERAARRARSERVKAWQAMNQQIEKEARLYQQIIIESLARMGYTWRTGRGSDPNTAGSSDQKGGLLNRAFGGGGSRSQKVKIDIVRYNESAIYFHVATTKRGLLTARSLLPYRTYVRDLMKDETITELQFACRKVVKAIRDDPLKGLWYVVYRNAGAGLLPGLVKFQSILEHYPLDRAAKCPIIIGVGENNTIHQIELDAFPHVLIAGASGGGKSNFLNNLLSQLIRFAPPGALQLILVDPKRVELAFYTDCPYLARPVIYEQSEAIAALDDLIGEMERRLKMMQASGVKKLSEWNHDHPDKPLPRLMIVIEEMASLWRGAKDKAKVQSALRRIAEMGRAAGVHIVVCTQTPTVDTVPTPLKTNLSLRISGIVASHIQSQIILDTGDAAWIEPVKGRMIYAVGAPKHKLQTPFITNDDVRESVAIARGRAAGLIALDGLTVKPIAAAFWQAVIIDHGGKLGERGLLAHFRGFAFTGAMIRALLDDLRAAGGVTLDKRDYGVQGDKLVWVNQPPPPVATIPPDRRIAPPVMLQLPAVAGQVAAGGPPAPDRALPGISERRAAGVYKRDRDLREAVIRLKNEIIPPDVEMLAGLMAAEYRRAGWACDVIVPVPLTIEKYSERGYNQSAVLAAVLGEIIGGEVAPDAMAKIADTGTQHRRSKAWSRANAQKGAYWADPALAGRAVLLIDDVCTSGATLSECAQTCRAAGAVDVYALTALAGFTEKPKRGKQ